MADLSGKLVQLNKIKPVHYEQILTWGTNSEESFFLLNFPPLPSRDDITRTLANKAVQTMLVSTFNNNVPIGLIQVGPVRSAERQTQIKFTVDTLLNYSAKTIIEAPSIILTSLFKDKKLHKVQAYTLEFEKEYESILKKLGFKKEGAYKNHFFHKEKYYSVNIFGLFKNDFLS